MLQELKSIEGNRASLISSLTGTMK